VNAGVIRLQWRDLGAVIQPFVLMLACWLVIRHFDLHLAPDSGPGALAAGAGLLAAVGIPGALVARGVLSAWQSTDRIGRQ
jgi:hypothetical protein